MLGEGQTTLSPLAKCCNHSERYNRSMVSAVPELTIITQTEGNDKLEDRDCARQ